MTNNSGDVWNRISETLPQGLWVSRVIASQHKKERVYAALNGYRNDDFKAYVYMSDDYGKTWKDISSNLPNTAAVNVIKEDSENELKIIDNYLKENLLNNKHEFETLSKSGSFITTLKRLVYSENIDMIVMGTTGATGATEIFMGSNNIKVIKNIDLCPII